MKKRPSQISSLLAARPQALRRPPPKSDTPASPAHLRLVRDDHATTPDTAPSSNDRQLISDTGCRPHVADTTGEPAGTCDAISAVREASGAIASIYALLTDLTDRMISPGRSHRRSPREVAELQALIDNTLRDVDRIADNATAGGTKLLTGYWSAPIVDGRYVNERRIPIQSMQTSHLGPDPVNCLLSLRTGGSNSLMVRSVEDALLILRHASLQVAQARRQLRALVPISTPEAGELAEIASENAAASQNACSDLDFVEMTSRLTSGACLAGSQHAARSAMRSSTRSRRQPPSDRS